MTRKPMSLDTSKLNATIAAVKENAAGVPYILWSVADTLNGALTERLDEALRLLIEGNILIPRPNPVDGPEISSFTAGCALIGAASQIDDLTTRDRILQLGSELVRNSGIQNVIGNISAAA